MAVQPEQASPQSPRRAPKATTSKAKIIPNRERAREGVFAIFGMLLGFVPWVAFWILASTPFHVYGMAIALGVSLLLGWRDLVQRRAKALDIATIAFFAVDLFVTGPPFHSPLFRGHEPIAIDIVLASVAWGTLIFGDPFTAQYARSHVAERFWDSPCFARVNRILTGAWAIIFTIGVISTSLTIPFPHDGRLLTTIVPAVTTIAGLLFSLIFAAPRFAGHYVEPHVAKIFPGPKGDAVVEVEPGKTTC